MLLSVLGTDFAVFWKVVSYTHTQFVYLMPFLHHMNHLQFENLPCQIDPAYREYIQNCPLFSPPDKSTQISWTPRQTGQEKESTCGHFISVGPFQDEGGELILVVSSITDRNPRRRALRALSDTWSAVNSKLSCCCFSALLPSPERSPILCSVLYIKCQQFIQGRALIWMSNKTD